MAGAIGGVLTQRSAPDVVSEAAPLWGFVCGVTTGILCAALAVTSGGSLGAQRLSEVGPSAWQVGLVAALEVGVAAAVAAWIANWWYTREPSREVAADRERKGEAEKTAEPAPPAVELPPDVPMGRGLATVTPLRPRVESAEEKTGRNPAAEVAVTEHRAEPRRARRQDRRMERRARKEARRELRYQRRARKSTRSWWRPGGGEPTEDEMYGITYEAAPEEFERRE